MSTMVVTTVSLAVFVCLHPPIVCTVRMVIQGQCYTSTCHFSCHSRHANPLWCMPVVVPCFGGAQSATHWPEAAPVLREYLRVAPGSRAPWQLEALAEGFSKLPAFAKVPWQVSEWESGWYVSEVCGSGSEVGV